MKKITVFILLLNFGFFVFAQDTKRLLQFDDILKWNRITEKKISNDGSTIVYKNDPWKGDPVLIISNKKGEEKTSINCGTGAAITADSRFVTFTIKPATDVINELKQKKAKKEDMPLNVLGIYNIKNNSIEKIPRLKSHKIPLKWSGWIAYQTEAEKVKSEAKKDEEKESDTDTKEKIKKENANNGYNLNIRNLNTDEVIKFPYVKQYYFAEEKEHIVFVSTGNDKEFEPGLYHYNLKSKSQTALLTGKGDYKQITLKKEGEMIAFLADLSDEKDKKKNYSLYFWNGNGQAKELLNNNNDAIPENWKISENGRISFSETTKRIFFGTAPIIPEKDTTILKEDIPVLDIWHWEEPILQTQQIKNKSRIMNKSYRAVYHIDDNKMVQLESKKLSGISLINKGDAEYVLGISNVPYALQVMWEGGPVHNDFYLIDIYNGKAKLIKKDIRASTSVSPGGKYLFWYNAIDTTWNTYNINTRVEYKVTSPDIVQCANELNDSPMLSVPYGSAGWLDNDEAFFVYDRYDIWKIDAENRNSAVNMTVNGKEKNINYRIIRLDREMEFFDPGKAVYLTGHNEKTRADGYYKWSLKKQNAPVKLISGNYKLGNIIKAKDTNELIYSKESFEIYPDILVSDLSFKNSIKISDSNPQQKEFLWGTAELYSWTSLDGRKLEGTVHKPENFDHDKKYPMIVNFYEKSSQELFGYRMPEAHRSTVDYHYYTSNGYIVFNPDVYYKEGYPGEDAFNCVMPGVTALIAEGYIDEDHIGAQGHSWGGYQVAYLATRTNIFAAIESGAPVVNMFSAYGGIRWGSGLNRSFQYEHTQSRIGKTIWESPLRYIENSPIFTMDKVTTPILIMHNDNDGSVPWYQGIEYFIALRRLGKKAWLLNYNEADHWPTKIRDKHDFQIRLAQFFDHYLKEKPMPKWMKEGIPAVNKGIDLGYELVK
ncbi:alpha/beta hydrolase family protein [Bacteroidota bacterium]